MNKLLTLLPVFTIINGIVFAGTNLTVRIKPIKNWRIPGEGIDFSLIINNTGDVSVPVATNSSDLFFCQLFGENSFFDKGSISESFRVLYEDGDGPFLSLCPSNIYVSDVINEHYSPLYATNDNRRLSFYVGNGIWFDTEAFTNNTVVINPSQKNDLGNIQLQNPFSGECFTATFFSVVIPENERWVYHYQNIPVCRMRPVNQISITQAAPSDWVRITDGVSVVLFNCRMLRVEQGDAYATPHWQWIQDERQRNR